MENPRKLAPALQLSMVLLPALVMMVVLARFYTPVPIVDDYHQMFLFALDYHAAHGFSAKLFNLFAVQEGDYKLIFEHTLAALQLEFLGHLSWPPLIWLGNLMPLGIFALLALHADQDHTPSRGRILAVLLPVSCFVFSLNYAETLNWVACGLQYQVVICFSLASLHFLTRPANLARNLTLACLCAVIAVCAFPNGMFVFLAGFVFLLFTARRYPDFATRLVAWTLTFAGSVGLYLWNYRRGAAGAQGSLTGKALFLVMWVGGGLENMHHRPVPYLSLAIGLGILLVMFEAVRTRFDRRNPFAFYAALWVMITAVVVANGRMGYGLQQSLSSRYKIYCDLLLAISFIYGLDRVHRTRPGVERTYLRAAAVISLLYCSASAVAGAKFLAARQIRCNDAMRRYLAAPDKASPMFIVDDHILTPGQLEDLDTSRREMNQLRAAGIYTPPQP